MLHTDLRILQLRSGFFKCKWWGASFNSLWQVQRTNFYSFVYIFLFLSPTVYFVVPPKKGKQSWQMDDKKESILCFYWEFYEGNLSDTPTKKLNDSSYPIFQILHLFFFLCMLAEGRVWDGGKQRQYHMVLLSQARLALKFTTYCNAAVVAGLCVSVGKKQRDKRSLGRL